jgi:hypothetical protein
LPELKMSLKVEGIFKNASGDYSEEEEEHVRV